MRWTTIGLSAASQDIPAPEAAPQPVDWKKRIASIWIPAILGLGLVMSFAYLGVRIVAGKSQVSVPSSLPSPPPPAKVEPSSTASVKTESKPVAASKPAPAAALQAMPFTLVTPQAGERYLQVAAVSPHMVLTYIDTLRQTDLEAVVAPGPTPDLLRILVGPFADHDSLEKARAQLVTAGRSPIVRIY